MHRCMRMSQPWCFCINTPTHSTGSVPTPRITYEMMPFSGCIMMARPQVMARRIFTPWRWRNCVNSDMTILMLCGRQSAIIWMIRACSLGEQVLRYSAVRTAVSKPMMALPVYMIVPWAIWKSMSRSHRGLACGPNKPRKTARGGRGAGAAFAF